MLSQATLLLLTLLLTLMPGQHLTDVLHLAELLDLWRKSLRQATQHRMASLGMMSHPG